MLVLEVACYQEIRNPAITFRNTYIHLILQLIGVDRYMGKFLFDIPTVLLITPDTCKQLQPVSDASNEGRDIGDDTALRCNRVSLRLLY